MPRVSVVVSGDFCPFKLALLSLLSMSKDEDFERVQIFNGSSRNLTPGHTTRDAFMNSSLAFSRDVSLGHLWYIGTAFFTSDEWTIP